METILCTGTTAIPVFQHADESALREIQRVGKGGGCGESNVRNPVTLNEVGLFKEETTLRSKSGSETTSEQVSCSQIARERHLFIAFI